MVLDKQLNPYILPASWRQREHPTGLGIWKPPSLPAFIQLLQKTPHLNFIKIVPPTMDQTFKYMSLNGSVLLKPPQKAFSIMLGTAASNPCHGLSHLFLISPETPEDGDGKKHYFRVCSNGIYLGWRTNWHMAHTLVTAPHFRFDGPPHQNKFLKQLMFLSDDWKSIPSTPCRPVFLSFWSSGVFANTGEITVQLAGTLMENEVMQSKPAVLHGYM